MAASATLRVTVLITGGSPQKTSREGE